MIASDMAMVGPTHAGGAATWSRASVWAATMSSPKGPAAPPGGSRRRHASR